MWLEDEIASGISGRPAPAGNKEEHRPEDEVGLPGDQHAKGDAGEGKAGKVVAIGAHREPDDRDQSQERQVDLADGKVSPDMAWALAMADRVRADRQQIFDEHSQVTDALNALRTAGLNAHDKEAVDFAEAAAADSLNDSEILEPAAVLVGDYLRSRLPPAH